MKKLLSIVLMISGLLLATACVERAEEIGKEEMAPPKHEVVSTTTVADLKSGIEQYRGTEVTIAGTVRGGLAFEFVDEQPYLLDDGTGVVWIITRDIMPTEGSVIVVSGTVHAPYQIKGRRYEIALLETGRQ